MSVLQKFKSNAQKFATSRTQIAIKGAKDGILLLPNNQYRAVLEVSSLNFELKSEDEQDAIIDTYESFLNSVGTSLQILIRLVRLIWISTLKTSLCGLRTKPKKSTVTSW